MWREQLCVNGIALGMLDLAPSDEMEGCSLAALNKKTVRLLMRDMAPAFRLQRGQNFTREQAVQWFHEKYPNVKEGTVPAHLYRLATNVRARLRYSARAGWF